MVSIPRRTKDRLRFVLDLSWEILFHKIRSGKATINKESSMQLQYSVILHHLGDLLCIQPNENFTIELESTHKNKNIDIVCSYNEVKAAVELKCFRKASNRAVDTDMYDVLKDLERLFSYSDFQVKSFICLTDNAYYSRTKHSGHAGSVTIQDGVAYKKGIPITPSWAKKWSSSSRDKPIILSRDVAFNWIELDGWYVLKMDI